MRKRFIGNAGVGPRAHLFGRPLTMGSRPGMVAYRVESPAWALPPLTIAVLSDFHTCLPWTPPAAISRVVEMANGTGADMILLGGDFLKDGKMPGVTVPPDATVRALEGLSAPLGVFAVLGNHDWKDCRTARATGFVRNSVAEAFAGTALRLLRNEAVRVGHGAGQGVGNGEGFWLVGFDSQRPHHDPRLGGFHDPARAFREVPEGAPAILLAHEPDWFGEGDGRAFLQISGHTHGGQANLFGWRPLTPSVHGPRYAWGHVREGGRHLIVSGGIGYSGLPLRILQPPEITLVTVTGA